jgi:hypothetical protein
MLEPAGAMLIVPAAITIKIITNSKIVNLLLGRFLIIAKYGILVRVSILYLAFNMPNTVANAVRIRIVIERIIIEVSSFKRKHPPVQAFSLATQKFKLDA